MIAEMLAGGGIMLFGVVSGWIAARRFTGRGRTPKPVSAVCGGCKHGRSMHLEGKGRCMEVAIEAYWEYDVTTDDDVRKHKEYPCSCQVYDGPERLPEYYLPEVEG